MTIRIADVEYQLPESILTNDDLKRANPAWEMDRVEGKAGVCERRIAAPLETALDLGKSAALKLMNRHPGLRDRLGAVLFCTQTPDYVMPPNACLLHAELDLPETVACFDFTLACSGWVYGLAIARGLIASSLTSDVLLVTGDTYSKLIHPMDRSARVLFGDGAAATWLTASEGASGVLDIDCRTDGHRADRFIVRAGGCRMPRSLRTAESWTDQSGNVHTSEHIEMDGMGVLSFANSKVPEQIRALLDRNGLTVADIDLFIFHQASGMALHSLARLLQVPAGRSYVNIAKVGNTVSASIPIALKDAISEQRITSGQMIVVSGFGVGLSWASALIRM